MLRLLVNMRLSKGCKRLYIQQPSSSSSDSEEEQEWDKYKIKDNNMFTVDKYQQINIFPNEKVFALRYQTAGMLETVLRQGVLGEDDIGEEFPKNLKLPSRRPAIVCETCLFSLKKDMRARAFHIMDSKGIIEMIHIFLEERGGEVLIVPSLDDSNKSELDVDYVSIPIIHIDQDSDATMVQVSFGDRLGALIDTNDNIVIDNIL